MATSSLVKPSIPSAAVKMVEEGDEIGRGVSGNETFVGADVSTLHPAMMETIVEMMMILARKVWEVRLFFMV